MASVTSLGIHKPSAFPFLVAEGILPPDAGEDFFKWQILYGDATEEYEEEEELVTTHHCVVWSRGSVILRVFRFNVENEIITQAFFTTFAHGVEASTVALKNQQWKTYPRSHDETARAKPHVDGSRVRPEPDLISDAFTPEHAKSTNDFRDLQKRALVVILRTQAHVCSLSGTNHIVHMPFETDIAFPSPFGVFFQRKVQKQCLRLPESPLPSAPHNSFAMADSNSPVRTQTSVRRFNVNPTLGSKELKILTETLSRDSEDKLFEVASTTFPRTYSLSDPLAEMGIVVADSRSTSTGFLNLPKSNFPRNGVLDLDEDLLYVSPYDELRSHRQQPPAMPCVLAVTQNARTRLQTIWTVAHIDPVPISQRQSSSTSNSRRPRRRSSYGPGVITGATTPGAMGTHDSLGISRLRGQAVRDVAPEESFSLAEEDLVSHLDPAFGEPSAPAKSYRRVSSLLARADLSTGHERSTFSELAAGVGGSRRWASFGTHGARSSFGLEGGAGISSIKRVSSVRSTPNRASSYDLSLDEEVIQDEIRPDSIKSENPSLGSFDGSLQKEMLLTKVCSMPIRNGSSSHSLTHRSKNHTRFKIFTLEPPNHDLNDDSADALIILSIFDRDNRELSVLKLTVPWYSLTKNTDGTRQAKNEKSRSKIQTPKAEFADITVCANIIDACKISEGDCYRILLIRENADNTDELSLQAPWCAEYRFRLPSSLLIHNPYRQKTGDSDSQKTEGGFKRILSERPFAYVNLQHEDSNGKVDVVDTEGRRHRILIQLKPHVPSVRKIISVSESVLPRSQRNGESILRSWWDAVSWLSSCSADETDLEWRAIVVVLFSMATGCIEGGHSETSARQNKRKGGFLRSSSGANIDLESWTSMLNKESKFSVAPVWTQDSAWKWIDRHDTRKSLDSSLSRNSYASNSLPLASHGGLFSQRRSSSVIYCVSLARSFLKTSVGLTAHGERGYLPTALSKDAHSRRTALATVLVGLHLLREELKLDTLAAKEHENLAPVLAQIGGWLGWKSWGFKETSYYYLENPDIAARLFDDSVINLVTVPSEPFPPPSILQFIENAYKRAKMQTFISLIPEVKLPISRSGDKLPSKAGMRLLMSLTPRTIAITGILASYSQQTAEDLVEDVITWEVNKLTLETLPESVALSIRSALSSCQMQPGTKWSKLFLETIGRDDIRLLEQGSRMVKFPVRSVITSSDVARDVHSICKSTFDIDTVGSYDGSSEGDRHAITRMMFKDDQRFAEAARMVHPLSAPTARCAAEPDWSDTDLLEAQQELAKIIAMRTLSVSVGRSLLLYCARMPLLAEKFPIHGFTLSCVMKPANITVTADRNAYTEEKVSWAFFHAGVEAGLSISKNAPGIETSWILFNKPQDLQNRHAGFLLGLGLNGHLKSIVKWVAFKYLTPKHTMTTIGLLLGLSASYLGTMDTLITRLLSVHVTRMLPPGAAELNISPLTQTSGIMGIGLLYCNRQHRRMSEIMLSEMESVDLGDNPNPMDSLRDEGYRLATGFALGYINLGQGKDLKGLHDMRVIERLLALAVGTRKVSIVQVLDKATAAAVIAIALIFMKTQNLNLARKIDIPDTVLQFDYVRPDMFLLRTVARHLIMWDNIHATSAWMKKHLPIAYRHKLMLTTVKVLNSKHMPFLNIVAGLCLSIGLRFAGTGSPEVRNLLCHYLDQYIRICKLPSLNYDGKLAKITVRSCQDVIALAAACVMAGTGDLVLFRRFRSLHGRTDADTSYGSHLAAHFALGVLFLGGGTHTFGTSNIAVASLLCAFYPIFPNTILDNKSHLQAFRHFWVFAVEHRCLVLRDVETFRPVSMLIKITLRTGTEIVKTAPCLLPEIETIARIETNDFEYWYVALDLANNSNHLEAFQRHQNLYVRRRAAYDSHASIFSVTMQALNDSQFIVQITQRIFAWIFTLPAFTKFGRAEQALILCSHTASTFSKALRGTVVDDRLMLETGCMKSSKSQRLWNLRVLFAWADGMNRCGERWRWLEKEVVEGLRAALDIKIQVDGRNQTKKG